MQVILDSNFFMYKKLIQKIFQTALAELCQEHADVGVTLNYVSEREIRQLNMKHRQLDKSTDVLSFPSFEIREGEKICDFLIENQTLVPLGDIVICKKYVITQSKTFKHSYKREICYLALHGFLHLLGYDHTVKEEDEKMCKLAETILEKCEVYR